MLLSVEIQSQPKISSILFYRVCNKHLSVRAPGMNGVWMVVLHVSGLPAIVYGASFYVYSSRLIMVMAFQIVAFRAVRKTIIQRLQTTIATTAKGRQSHDGIQ